MWKVLLSCIVLILGVPSSEEADSLVVQTAQGPVRGYKDPVENIYTFYSIPYAQAPTGANRYKAPLAPVIRNETLEAIDKGIICPQTTVSIFGEDKNNKIMQEDCLIANIYVPNTQETNLPVLVVIHGGSFLVAYGEVLQPKEIVNSHNIIVVNFNYRLGVHGFLCLGTSDIPGNAGLKDQVALLRWVQENIAYFGGNPEDVTLSGFSAGSSSVGLLTLSKMGSGLFKKVIQESGDIGSSFAMQVNPTQNAKDYASLSGFDNVDNITALEDFYKYTSLDDLQSPILTTINYSNLSNLMTPCVERNVGQEIFLDDTPQNILKSGKFSKLPTLIGFTNMEGLLYVPNLEAFSATMNSNFSNSLPTYLGFSNEETQNNAAEQVKNFYFGGETVSSTTILNYTQYYTESTFACPCLRTVKDLFTAGNNDIYLFYYSFVDEASTPPVPYTDGVYGAQHIAETYALSDGVNITYQDESNISNKLKNWKILLRDTWSEFVINGVPSSAGLPEWPPVSDDSLTYMALKETPELGVSPLEEPCSFWKNLYDTYYQAPNRPEELTSS